MPPEKDGCAGWPGNASITAQRVQNSVFECLLDAAQYRQVRHLLEELIDREKDSLRFYNLGDHYHTRVEHVGAHPSYDAEGVLFG